MLPGLWKSSTVTLLVLIHLSGCYSLQEPEEVPWYENNELYAAKHSIRQTVSTARNGDWFATSDSKFFANSLENPYSEGANDVVIKITISIDSKSGHMPIMNQPAVRIKGGGQELRYIERGITIEHPSWVPWALEGTQTTVSNFYYHKPNMQGLEDGFSLDIYIANPFRDRKISHVDVVAAILIKEKEEVQRKHYCAVQ